MSLWSCAKEIAYAPSKLELCGAAFVFHTAARGVFRFHADAKTLGRDHDAVPSILPKQF